MQKALLLSVVLALAAFADRACAQDDGIQFVTIGSPGNSPWPGDGHSGDMAVGRGSVAYEYRLGTYEVTTAQWVNFFNAAYDRPQSQWPPFLTPPTYWGAVPTTPNTPGGMRWAVPAGHEMYPVGDISWRMAAEFCNWMCNGAQASPDRTAFLNGAYDVSTFGYIGDRFTDQLTHNPGAAFWIPTLDEWIKAAHFDPNRYGQGQAGWWVYSNRTNSPLIGGPPGVGQANFGFNDGSQFSIPLGAYPQTQSPWGLFDMAGGTSEWLEETLTGSTGTRYRAFDGSFWGSDPGHYVLDSIYSFGGDFPSIPIVDYGFRIASSVPSPASGCVPMGLLVWHTLRRRRGNEVHKNPPRGARARVGA